MWGGGQNGPIVDRTVLASCTLPQAICCSCRLGPSQPSEILSPVICVTLNKSWYNASYEKGETP